MASHNTKNFKVSRIKVDGTNYQAAAGATDLTSEAVDMQGFESCECIVLVGAITSGAVTSLRASQCDTSGGSYADLLGSDVAIADTDDNKAARLEIVSPRERFLKFVTKRATQNAVVEGMIVTQRGARKLPVADASTVVGSEIHVSPAEGTA